MLVHGSIDSGETGLPAFGLTINPEDGYGKGDPASLWVKTGRRGGSGTVKIAKPELVVSQSVEHLVRNDGILVDGDRSNADAAGI